ncbi:hypothetical protein [Nocardia australiensis]|uniref:hypothetical protein n=1 Tax=Nocardia australiensis TaxID=2887191 RepID=UPI001D1386BD|nr:hypothetical protein [Nocardia australiensis]
MVDLQADGAWALIVGAVLLGLVAIAPIPRQYLPIVLPCVVGLAFAETIGAAAIVACGRMVIEDFDYVRYMRKEHGARVVEFRAGFIFLVFGLAAILTAASSWLIRELIDRSRPDQ